MKRSTAINRLSNKSEIWDILVVGGGATGLGCAVDAAARGYKVALVEQADFAKGTSSRSTKLVHGGVRYLKQGNISLVLEALKERGLLCENAPHLVSHQSFIVPNYNWWEGPFYGIGMKVYDVLAGKLGLEASRNLSKQETLEQIPTLEEKDLVGGVIYYDGQFDDARLATNLAQTVWDLSGVAVNYVKATGLLQEGGLTSGVMAQDMESGDELEIRAKCVINAAGVFSDGLRRMDEPDGKDIIAASRGVHLVLPKQFVPKDAAIMVPHTTDGRVLFAVPWHGYVVLGTTDESTEDICLEPRATEEEIDFILENAARYMHTNPTRDDVLSVYAGLRPLVKHGDSGNTAALSRDHTIIISETGLITIAGGKWTTYRKMAEDAIDHAETVAGFDKRDCRTHHLPIHGCTTRKFDGPALINLFGSDAEKILDLTREQPELIEPLHPRLPYCKGEAIWAAREEMARSVEDILARRTRSLLLDAQASIEAAPLVGQLLAKELGQDETWGKQSADTFIEIAKGYLVKA
ncbi:glycerol-3-phosphate dehydrogenase/oxidase [Rubellicoccus peritrichatus]|uniref:Glycerol-3-phosphate dehydrogenase/oxidase n=1 Tax=Rubellicoccus peritrichatus TaxID=3080537 RepID=A0AAQ3QSA5_9BACT|nr:glycerol-3-phosphate dehydrogenase/oxidase [Puniceicoccus sp. CR14]WOO42203.1 glycerol-3-phosphate dehydrogenase/oxidase [Puniceicoccus sp. CR14]